MKWKVVISGEKSSLEMMSQGFSNSSIKIEVDNGEYFMESDSFNTIDEMKDVYQKADEIVKWINGSMLHAIGFSGGIEIERIFTNFLRKVCMMDVHNTKISYANQ